MRKLVGITRKKPKQAVEARASFNDSDLVFFDTPSDAVGEFDPPSGLGNMSRSYSSENSSITFVSAARTDVTPDSAESDLQKGNGKSGKNLAMLSGKTDKIMSAYHDYLAEISTGSGDSSEWKEADPALKNVYDIRDNVRDSYDERQFQAAEEGGSDGSDDSSSSGSAGRDEGYATGGGKQLYRDWGYENENTSAFLSTEGLVCGEKSRNKTCVPHSWTHPLRVRRAICMAVVMAAMMSVSMGVTRHRKSSPNEVDGSPPDLEAENRFEIEEEDKNHELYAAMIRESEMKKKVLTSLDAEDIVGAMTLVPEAEETELGRHYNEEMEAGKQVDFTYEGEKKNDNPVVSETMTEGGTQEGSDSYIDEEQEAKDAPVAAIEPLDQLSSGDDAALIEAQASVMDLYYQAVVKYRPVMYDRSMGWTGRTYRDALLFCQFQGGLSVCPYEAVCPDGYNGEPLGGFRAETNSDWAWVPIIGDYNEWVQAGAREKCVKYSERYGGEGPEWGVSGKGQEVEGITRNIMCCVNTM